MIRLNCFFTLADEEKKKAFVSLAQELVEKSRTDAGCSAYDILFSCTNPLTGMICETWQDQASLDLHAHAEHADVRKAVFVQNTLGIFLSACADRKAPQNPGNKKIQFG